MISASHHCGFTVVKQLGSRVRFPVGAYVREERAGCGAVDMYKSKMGGLWGIVCGIAAYSVIHLDEWGERVDVSGECGEGGGGSAGAWHVLGGIMLTVTGCVGSCGVGELWCVCFVCFGVGGRGKMGGPSPRGLRAESARSAGNFGHVVISLYEWG